MAKNELEEGLELKLQFDKRGGFVPVVVQEEASGRVLMLAYANELAVRETFTLGLATLWSTSRNKLWTKGMDSGDKLEMTGVYVDCDQDALLYTVKVLGGGACHTKLMMGPRDDPAFIGSLKEPTAPCA